MSITTPAAGATEYVYLELDGVVMKTPGDDPDLFDRYADGWHQITREQALPWTAPPATETPAMPDDACTCAGQVFIECDCTGCRGEHVECRGYFWCDDCAEDVPEQHESLWHPEHEPEPARPAAMPDAGVFATALREFANFIEHTEPGLLAERIHPDQHEEISLLVTDVETLHDVAARHDLPVTGCDNQTWAAIGFGPGSRPDAVTDAHNHALTVRLVHIDHDTEENG